MIPHYAHQLVDAASLLEKPAYALFNDVGSGKSRIVVDAACELYRRGTIDTLLVVCPAPARSVWLDPDPALGEFSKWVASDIPHTLAEYHAKTNLAKLTATGLIVLVTNPEWLRYGGGSIDKRGYRMGEKAKTIYDFLKKRKAMLVADESWMFASHKASQAKTLYRLRQMCERVVLLNGTPGEMQHLYTQFCVLDRNIFTAPYEKDGVVTPGCCTWYAYRDHYLVMGGYMNKQVVGHRNVEEFQNRTRPYAVYRKTRDCVDLGETPIRTQIEVPLSPATWKIYCAMRDELVHWFSQNEAAVAQQAAVKTMRLAQITSGFVGGVQSFVDTGGVIPASETTREIGNEKITGLLTWLKDSWDHPKLVIFTRFRPDVERSVRLLAEAYPTHRVVPLYGRQSDEERTEAKTLLAPGGCADRAVVVCNTQSGQSALNFAAADTCVYLANDWSLKTRQQSEGRMRESVYPNRRVTYLDVLATGPKGERTIDHVMLAALRAHENVAAWTAETWREKLNG